MVPLPWKMLGTPESGKEYLALLSFLPLKHYRTIPRFFWLSLATQRQLQRSKGLIGYSMYAEIFRRRFWTLSVWEDYEALMGFVHQVPHSKIMQSLAPHMGKTEFVHWQVKGKELPLQWTEAKARMG